MSQKCSWGHLRDPVGPLSESPPVVHMPPPTFLQNVYVNINRIMSVGSRLLEAGHYASQQIKQISSQLEQEWKAFAAALDERSALLEMSAAFHQKCDQVRRPLCPHAFALVCIRSYSLKHCFVAMHFPCFHAGEHPVTHSVFRIML